MKRTPKTCRRTVGVLICIFLTLHFAFSPQTVAQGGLTITVVQGDRAKNVIQQIPAEPLSVRVEQGNRRPVQGAVVVFTAPSTGPGGQFDNGPTVTITTDANGVATAEGFHPNGIAGNYSIQVRAQYQNQTAIASIRQSNVESAKGHKKLITFLFIAGAAAGAAYVAKTNRDKNPNPSITFGDGAVGAPKP